MSLIALLQDSTIHIIDNSDAALEGWLPSVPNPNWALLVALLHRDKELLVAIPVVVAIAVCVFTAIWRNTRAPLAQRPQVLEWRLYTITDLALDRRERQIRACDVELVETGSRLLRFVGQKVDGGYPTIAIVKWQPQYVVTSEIIEEEATK